MTALDQKTDTFNDWRPQLETISGASAAPSQEAATDGPLNEMISAYQELHARRVQVRAELETMLRTIQRRSFSDYVAARDCDRVARPLTVPNFETLSALDNACDALGYNRAALDWRTSLCKDFVYRADTDELDALHALETQLRRIDSQCELLVEKILDEVPTSAQQALAKLKIMTSFMLDSECLEIDYFACLVAECAQMMEASPALAMNAG